MKIELDAGTQRRADRLIELVSINPDASLEEILAAAVSRISDNSDALYEREEAEARAMREEERADRAESLLAEAYPIIHASHGGQPPLADLSLCVHPDCTRFHS